MNTTTDTRAHKTVSAIAKAYLFAALAISFGHILTAAHMLGLNGWQSYTVPFAFDGLAILGMIGRSDKVANHPWVANPIAVKRFALGMQIVCGTLSLSANVYAGHTAGERIYGVIIVAVFLTVETFNGLLKAGKGKATAAQITTADVQAAVDAAIAQTLAQAATATEAAIASAVTEALAAEAANRHKVEQATRRRERAAAKRAEELRPVSPATEAAIESAYPAPFEAYEPAYL